MSTTGEFNLSVSSESEGHADSTEQEGQVLVTGNASQKSNAENGECGATSNATEAAPPPNEESVSTTTVTTDSAAQNMTSGGTEVVSLKGAARRKAKSVPSNSTGISRRFIRGYGKGGTRLSKIAFKLLQISEEEKRTGKRAEEAEEYGQGGQYGEDEGYCDPDYGQNVYPDNDPPLNIKFIANQYRSLLKDKIKNMYGLNIDRLIFSIMKKAYDEREDLNLWTNYFVQDKHPKVNFREILKIYFNVKEGAKQNTNRRVQAWFMRLAKPEEFHDNKSKLGAISRKLSHLAEAMGRIFTTKEYQRLGAAILAKLAEALSKLNDLPVAIVQMAKPYLDEHWETWCQRLSLPLELTGMYPNSLRGSNMKDSIDICEAYFIDRTTFRLDEFTVYSSQMGQYTDDDDSGEETDKYEEKDGGDDNSVNVDNPENGNDAAVDDDSDNSNQDNADEADDDVEVEEEVFLVHTEAEEAENRHQNKIRMLENKKKSLTETRNLLEKEIKEQEDLAKEAREECAYLKRLTQSQKGLEEVARDKNEAEELEIRALNIAANLYRQQGATGGVTRSQILQEFKQYTTEYLKLKTSENGATSSAELLSSGAAMQPAPAQPSVSLPGTSIPITSESNFTAPAPAKPSSSASSRIQTAEEQASVKESLSGLEMLMSNAVEPNVANTDQQSLTAKPHSSGVMDGDRDSQKSGRSEHSGRSKHRHASKHSRRRSGSCKSNKSKHSHKSGRSRKSSSSKKHGRSRKNSRESGKSRGTSRSRSHHRTTKVDSSDDQLTDSTEIVM